MRGKINQLLEELGAESFAVRKNLGFATHHIIARRSEGAASVTVEDYIERPYWLRTIRPAGRYEIEHLFHHLDCEVWKHQEFAKLRTYFVVDQFVATHSDIFELIQQPERINENQILPSHATKPD